MLMALIAIIYRSVEWVRPAPLLFLAAGISLWVIGDVILSLKVIADTYQPGSPADSFHLLSYVFWGLAGISQIFSVREGLYARRRSTKPWVTKWGEATPSFRAFIPPAVLLVTFLLLLQGLNQKLPMSFNLLLGWTGVLLFLTSLIQLLHLYHDRQLNRGLQKTNAELERRVAERTRTLSNMTEALRMSEAHYRAVVEDTPVLVCTFQEDGNLTFVNQAYAAYFNRVPDELVGRSFYSLISPEERQRVEKNIHSLSRENPVLMHEYSVTAPNGELRWQRWVNRMVIEGANIKFQAIGEDITDRRIAEERLRESEERYRLLFETMAQGVLYQDGQGRILSANPAAEQILGLPLNQLQGEHPNGPLWESIREDGSAFPDEEHPTIVAISTGKEVNNVVMGVTNSRDGGRRWINVHAFPQALPGEDQPARVYTTFEDITERKLSELALRDANLRLSRGVEELSLLARLDELLQLCQTDQEAYQAIDTVIEHIFSSERGSIFVVNSDGAYQARVVWGHMGDTEPISQSQCMALRYGRPYLVEDTRHGLLCDHVRPKAPVSSLCVPMIAQNEVYGSLHIEVELKDAKDGGLDETRRKLATMVGNSIALALSNIHLRDRLREQAVRDPLTGLFNRRFMEESLKRELLRVERSKNPLAVLMMDIDHFKVYNDTYGHEAGDLLLTEVAKLIRTRIRGSDIACRYGGEEIVLVIPDVAETTVLERAEKLRIEISQLRLPYGDEILEPVTVSIGVSMCPEDGLTPQDLLRRADQALYTAKEAGRNRVSL
jgi:diguanylate cyclase (GGDEF)-like protein/PAS domain S-box-containing protein